MTAEKILQLARNELGVVEYPPSSNRVKYNTAYYGREVSGSQYAWCAVFVWWLFRQAGASVLYYGGGKTAYCPTLMSYHKAQAVTDYNPGDVVFFNFDGGKNAQHVGVCESYDGTNITTIDGNTGTGNDANGGAVMRRTRNKRYVVGAYRPAYEEEVTLTEDQIRSIVRDEYSKIQEELAAKPADSWAQAGVELARAAGITDGSRPCSDATRQEVMLMCKATLDAAVKQIKKSISEAMKG